MAHSVAWSERAIEHVNAIGEYISKGSPHDAHAVVERILGVGKRLRQFPFAGRRVPEAKEHTFREVFVHSDRVIYRTRADAVTIVAVIHVRQRISGDDL